MTGLLRAVRTPCLPIGLAVLFVVLGVPVFLRLPLWCDVTLYDVAARSILSGGVHYRDVFDTNPPGFVWCLTLLRATLGNSAVAVRAVDLAVFTGIVFCLDRLVKMGGGSRASRAWAIAGMLSTYLFSTEYIHAQRDVWLALPILIALVLRLRRITRAAGGEMVGYFLPACAEGLLWGMATWIKPQVIPIAVIAWLLTVRRLSGGSWRIAGKDLAGNFVAGSVLGLIGLGYLVASGTWPHYWIVMTEWNVHYTDMMFNELEGRASLEWTWFRPWSAFLLPTLLPVIASLVDGRIFSSKWRSVGPGPVGQLLPPLAYDPAPSDPARFTRAVLAGIFFIWAATSLLIQREFIYVHVLEILLMIALWASHRWCWPALALAWIAALNVLFVVADTSPDLKENLRSALRGQDWSYDKVENDNRHPLTQPGYFRSWRAAFTTPLSGQDDARLKDAVKREKPGFGTRNYIATTNWEELGEVEAYLRQRGTRDRELVCWNEGVHSLYTSLDIKPGLRFMHIHNTDGIGDDAHRIMRDELKTNRSIRFVVLDLEFVTLINNWERTPYRPGRSLDNFVPELPKAPEGYKGWDDTFPYDGRKSVFRSKGGIGRYVVFEVSFPLGTVE